MKTQDAQQEPARPEDINLLLELLKMNDESGCFLAGTILCHRKGF